jgi:drug/metabolite transporter (DMT)-like permease
VTSRIARTAALSLPVLLFCVLAFSGGWRIHDGRVERVGPASTTAAAPVVASPPTSVSTDQVTIVRHLSTSVPWPAWASLILLCLLPAVASMLAWSGSRRGRDTAFSVPGGSS